MISGFKPLSLSQQTKDFLQSDFEKNLQPVGARQAPLDFNPEKPGGSSSKTTKNGSSGKNSPRGAINPDLKNISQKLPDAGELKAADTPTVDVFQNESKDDASGKSTIIGTKGDDTLQGTAGKDTMRGARGDDRMSGGDGDDRMRGGAGNDSMSGGDGDDKIITGRGDDVADGGAGDDTIVVNGKGSKTVDGGDGNDTLVLNGSAGDWASFFADDGTNDVFYTNFDGTTVKTSGIENVRYALDG